MNLALGFFAALVLGVVVLSGVLLVGGRERSRARAVARSLGAFAVGFGATGVVSTALGAGSGRMSRVLLAGAVGAAVGIVSAWLGRRSGFDGGAEQDAHR